MLFDFTVTFPKCLRNLSKDRANGMKAIEVAWLRMSGSMAL